MSLSNGLSVCLAHCLSLCVSLVRRSLSVYACGCVCCACFCVCVTHFGLFSLCCSLFLSSVLCILEHWPFFIQCCLFSAASRGRPLAQGKHFFCHLASFTRSLLKLLTCPKRVEQVAAVCVFAVVWEKDSSTETCCEMAQRAPHSLLRPLRSRVVR